MAGLFSMSATSGGLISSAARRRSGESWQANVEVAVAAAHWPTAKVLEEIEVKEVLNEHNLKEIFDDIALDRGWEDDAFTGKMEKAGG